MKQLLAIIVCLGVYAACAEDPDDRVQLRICGDLVVPDEIDTLRISVIQKDDEEVGARLYVLGSADGKPPAPVADSTPVPDPQMTGMGGAMQSMMSEAAPPDPRAGKGWFGDPCSDTSECEHGRAECLTAEDGFPGGACIKACGSGAGNCPKSPGAPKAFCVQMEGVEKGRCLPTCDVEIIPDNGGCRPGYRCAELPNHAGNVQRSVCVEGPPAPQEPEDDMMDMMDIEMPSPKPEVAPRPKGPQVSVEQRVRIDNETSRVRVEGYSRGRTVVVAEVRGEGNLAVSLDYACLKAVNCSAGTTCVDGECVTIPVGGKCP